MSDRTLRRLFALVSAALVGVVVASAVLGSRSIAHDLRDRSQQALVAGGLADVHVRFSGREAELSGGNDVEARLASALVGSLPGVRSITVDRSDRRPVPGAARFELDRAGDVVEISGSVRSPDDAAAIKVGVATALHTTVTGDVTVSSAVGRADWTAELATVFALVADVDGLELQIRGDGSVELGGDVGSVRERRRIAGQVADALPGLDLVDHLRTGATSHRGA